MRAVRLVLVTAILASVVVGAAAIATAQPGVPTVAVTAGQGSISVSPAGPIAAGPTRFTFRSRGRGASEAFLATLRAGISEAEMRRALRRGPDAVLGLIFIEAAGAPSNPPSSVTVDLRPNIPYYAILLAGRTTAVTSFEVGERGGSTAPRPAASIRMVDYGFRGKGTLPRNGLIRVRNDGSAPHFALAFPLRPGTRQRQVARAFKGGSDRALGQIVAGAPVSVQGLISPASTNDNQIRFQRPGRYAFVCFFGEHNRLGMYRTFRVR